MSFSYLNEVWEKTDPMKKISKKISRTMTDTQSENSKTEDLKTEDLLTNDSTDLFTMMDTSVAQDCNDFMDHVRSCRKCSHKLKAMMNNNPISLTAEKDDWKETLIIVVGAVIVIMLLFMMSRQFSK